MSNPPPLPPAQPGARRPSRKFHWMVAGLFLVTYLTACGLPAIITDKDTWSGGNLLVMGPMGIFLGHAAWYAHVPLLAALVFMLVRMERAAFALAAVAFLTGLQTYSMKGVSIPLDEANVRQAVVQSIGPAAAVWLASMAVLGVGALVARALSKRAA